MEAVTEVRGKLSDDLARCHDAACPERVICARYIQFGSGRVHTQSLRRGAESCASLILDNSP